MALRLRRGTNVERQLLTPLEGELIYTTDTKSLYVGDGLTLGGVLIAASGEVSNTLNGLLDTDIVGLQDGDVLVYNGTTGEWGNNQSALDLDDINDVLLTSAVNGDVLFYDGNSWKNVEFNSLVDSSNVIELNDITDILIQGTPERGEVLFHDGSIFKNVPAGDLADIILGQQQTHTLTLRGNDSTILVDPVTNTFTGELQGDAYGSLFDGIGNLIIDEFSKAAMVDLRDPTNTYTVLDNFTGDLRRGETGDLIIQGGANPIFIGNVEGTIKGTIVSPDLQIILNHDNATLYGTVSGSLRSDDSTLVFNGDTGKFDLDDTVSGSIKTRAVDDFPRLTMVRESATDIASDDLTYGSIQWRRDDINGEETTAFISGGREALLFVQDSTSAMAADKFMVLDEGSLSIGGFTPTAKLDVRGNVKASGSIQPGVYADNTARDAAITSPVAGMMVFNSAGAKFQGYDGTAWVDLN